MKSAPPQFSFASTVDASYHDALESLFYFHPLQARYYDQIVDNVERYGQPAIHEERGRLSIRLDHIASVKSNFAFYGPKLAGVIVYTVEEETLVIIHIAVDPDFLSNAMTQPFNMAEMLILDTVRQCGDRTVRNIAIRYKNRVFRADFAF